MDERQLAESLSDLIPFSLAVDLVSEYARIRQDVVTGTLGGSAPGKFVESFAQVLEQLGDGHYNEQPNVDKVLRDAEQNTSIDEGLRICAARVARAMYALRNKRNIAHKGRVDLNQCDLQFLHDCAQWIMTELLRLSLGVPMSEAAIRVKQNRAQQLVRQVQMQPGTLVEDFGDHKLVLATPRMLTTKQEIECLLAQSYPASLSTRELMVSLSRRSPSSVAKSLKSLWADKLVERRLDSKYVLTALGVDDAQQVMTHLAQETENRRWQVMSKSTRVRAQGKA